MRPSLLILTVRTSPHARVRMIRIPNIANGARETGPMADREVARIRRLHGRRARRAMLPARQCGSFRSARTRAISRAWQQCPAPTAMFARRHRSVRGALRAHRGSAVAPPTATPRDRRRAAAVLHLRQRRRDPGETTGQARPPERCSRGADLPVHQKILRGGHTAVSGKLKPLCGGGQRRRLSDSLHFHELSGLCPERCEW